MNYEFENDALSWLLAPVPVQMFRDDAVKAGFVLDGHGP